MSTINLFRSAFDNNHEIINIDKNIAIRQAVPEVEYTDSIISVNGEQIDENYVLQKKDICTIRLFPKGGAVTHRFTP